MSENIADKTSESIDLFQLLDSAIPLFDLSSVNNDLFGTESLTMVHYDEANNFTIRPDNDLFGTESLTVSHYDEASNLTISPDDLGSLILPGDVPLQMSVDEKGPGSTSTQDANNECSCVQQRCFEKMKMLRQRHRRYMKRQNYRCRIQQKLIIGLRLAHSNGNASSNNEIVNNEMLTETETSLPMALKATQRNLEKIWNRSCSKARIGLTYVIENELDPNDFVTYCRCFKHDCTKAFQVLRNFQEEQIKRQNQTLIKNDKLIEQLEKND